MARKMDVLDHPRRRLLWKLVRKDPGVNFRGLVRRAKLAPATARHHLSVLVSSQLLVERSHGCTVRFFDPDAMDEAWAEAVLRRDPALAELHDWLKANPRSPQRTVVEAMRARGWARSSTQHRLARLVAGGAATIFVQGRYKLYGAAAAEPPPGFVLQTPQGERKAASIEAVRCIGTGAA